MQELREKFSAAQPHQIAAQLSVSGNIEFPSSRSFLVQVDDHAADVRPALLHSIVKEYERLPHYTEKAEHYEELGDHWEPMSAAAEATQQSEAMAHMQDLSSFAEDPKVRAHFEERRKFWRELKRLEMGGSRGETIRFLKHLLAQHPKDGVTRAAVRDFLEIIHLNPDGEFPMNITASDVGLEAEASEIFSKCLQLKLEQETR